MSEITCPLCGKLNPDDRDECIYCQAPLKPAGFTAPSEGRDEAEEESPLSEIPGEAGGPADSSLEQAIPDWLRDTEANFLVPEEGKPDEPGVSQVSDQIDSLLDQPLTQSSESAPTIDDDWLESLLAEAGLNEITPEYPRDGPDEARGEPGEGAKVSGTFNESAEEEQPLQEEPIEKPDWLQDLEAGSSSKLESEPLLWEEEIGTGTLKPGEEKGPREYDFSNTPTEPGDEDAEPESSLAPAELPGWLEALRPTEEIKTSGPVEDLSTAEVVTEGPLVGLRGVISAHPSALRARKPPTYSIKLRVTDEQRSRVEMMEELLRDEQKPKPLPTRSIISSRNITRLVIAVVLLVPIVWMVITGSQRTASPHPANFPGVVDFTQQIQILPSGSPVLLAFDYEAGFSGEMKPAVNTLLSQLMNKNAFLAFVTTSTAGPALAESMLVASQESSAVGAASYTNYANLGFIPGGSTGLLGLATSLRSLMPYSLTGESVWLATPLNVIDSITDFSAVIVITSDPGTARSWIEQVGPFLKAEGKPLLFITSSQAEPLIHPFFEAVPSQVQGMVAGLAGGLAYARTGGSIQQNGTWDAFSIGVTISALIILIGAVIGVVVKVLATEKRTED